MKTRLSSSVGERINLFDNADDTSVGAFNNLFPECPLTDTDLLANVMIGSPLSSNRRSLLVDGLVVEHKMFSDLIYGIDKDLYNEEEKELDEMFGYPV